MDDNNVFLLAARHKYRFGSVNGDLLAEQLFDLPLTSRTGLDLDTIARTINASLKEAGEESFVNTRNKANPSRTVLVNKLELVKTVIAVKEAEAEAKQDEKAKAARRAELREALADRQRDNLRSMSEEELKEQLAKLS